jgi:hypothetical protein
MTDDDTGAQRARAHDPARRAPQNEPAPETTGTGGDDELRPLCRHNPLYWINRMTDDGDIVTICEICGARGYDGIGYDLFG